MGDGEMDERLDAPIRREEILHALADVERQLRVIKEVLSNPANVDFELDVGFEVIDIPSVADRVGPVWARKCRGDLEAS